MIGDLLPHPDWIVPQWPVPRRVRALLTTRAGGYSQGPWAAGDGSGGLNLGLGEDAIADVQRNRARVQLALPREPLWLHQVHGVTVVDATSAGDRPRADAAFTTVDTRVCAVMFADCLPVLFADSAGRGVAVAHAGWRGLAAGVLQQTVAALRHAIGDRGARIVAYLGPAIGPAHFEVGPEVLAAMRQHLPRASLAFADAAFGKYRADLCALARQALQQVCIAEGDVHGGQWCTASDPMRFYSFRRDRVTGRHGAFIWLDPDPQR
jgi:YfiH family protein